MNEKEAQSNTSQVLWPFTYLTSEGIGNTVDGFALYRNTMQWISDTAHKVIYGNYDDIAKTWQKGFGNGGQEILEAFFKPYQKTGTSTFDETSFAENVFKNWPQLKIEDFYPKGYPSRVTAEMKSFFDSWRKDAQDLYRDCHDCLQNMIKAYQEFITARGDRMQALETLIDACGELRDAFVTANLSFSRKQADAGFRLLKAYVPSNAVTKTEEKEESDREVKKAGRKARPE